MNRPLKEGLQLVLKPRFDALRFRLDPIDHDLNVVARRRVRLNQPIGVSLRVVRVRAADRDEPPLRQQRLDEGDAAERDSLALQRRPDRLIILIVAQDALGPDRAQTHGMEPVGPLQPGAIRVVVFDENVVWRSNSASSRLTPSEGWATGATASPNRRCDPGGAFAAAQ